MAVLSTVSSRFLHVNSVRYFVLIYTNNKTGRIVMDARVKLPVFGCLAPLTLRLLLMAAEMSSIVQQEKWAHDPAGLTGSE